MGKGNNGNWWETLFQRQALMFNKSLWDIDRAKEYLKTNNIDYYKIRTHKNYWHFRLFRTHNRNGHRENMYAWVDYRTKSRGSGIIEIQAVNDWDR